MEGHLRGIKDMHPPSVKQFLAVVEKPKADMKDWKAYVAATNVSTILMRAGVQFVGEDLLGVGAEMFDSARLEGADLRGSHVTGGQFLVDQWLADILAPHLLSNPASDDDSNLCWARLD
ncbi:hypothetical protein BGZ79_001694 [Entomortierella chlamydospora]|nr:hypothetical protein BGZ79_001694 [Entomortierella chlamydospora]